MQTGRRAWRLRALHRSTRAFLLAGMLTAAAYFDRDTSDERRSATLADALYRRVDWRWALDGGATVTHGWKPESGFLPLPLGGLRRGAAPLRARPRLAHVPAAPTRATTPGCPRTSGRRSTATSSSTPARCSSTRSRTCGSTSAASRMPSCASGASTTSRTAAGRRSSSSAYAIDNPLGFAGYGEHCWGITASDGPGPSTVRVDGVARVSTTTRARRAVRSRRRHARTVGVSWRRCRSRRRSCCRRSSTMAHDLDLQRGQPLRLQGDLQPDVSRTRAAARTAGSRRTTTASTRVRSSS